MGDTKEEFSESLFHTQLIARVPKSIYQLKKNDSAKTYNITIGRVITLISSVSCMELVKNDSIHQLIVNSSTEKSTVTTSSTAKKNQQNEILIAKSRVLYQVFSEFISHELHEYLYDRLVMDSIYSFFHTVKEHFVKENSISTFKLQQQLHTNLPIPTNATPTDVIHAVEALRAEISKRAVDVDMPYKVAVFNHLPLDYRMTLLPQMGNADFTFDQLRTNVLIYEENAKCLEKPRYQPSFSSNSTNQLNTAFMSNTNNSDNSNQYCTNCKNSTHNTDECKRTRGRVCNYCKESDHFVSNCPKIKEMERICSSAATSSKPTSNNNNSNSITGFKAHTAYVAEAKNPFISDDAEYERLKYRTFAVDIVNNENRVNQAQQQIESIQRELDQLRKSLNLSLTEKIQMSANESVQSNNTSINNTTRGIEKNEKNFYLDSASKIHVTNNKQLLQNIRTISSITVSVADGNCVSSDTMGDIELFTPNGIPLRLNNVLYSSQFTANLISVPVLLSEKQFSSVNFLATRAELKSSQYSKHATIPFRYGMYMITIKNSVKKSSQHKTHTNTAIPSEKSSTTRLWSSLFNQSKA